MEINVDYLDGEPNSEDDINSIIFEIMKNINNQYNLTSDEYVKYTNTLKRILLDDF